MILSKSKTKPRVDFVFLRHKNNNNPHLKFITFSLLRRLIFCIQSYYSLTRRFTREKIFKNNLQENLQEKYSGKIFRKYIQELSSGIIFSNFLEEKSSDTAAAKLVCTLLVQNFFNPKIFCWKFMVLYNLPV